MKKIFISLLLLTISTFSTFAQSVEFDVIIKNVTIYDGSGGNLLKLMSASKAIRSRQLET